MMNPKQFSQAEESKRTFPIPQSDKYWSLCAGVEACIDVNMTWDLTFAKDEAKKFHQYLGCELGFESELLRKPSAARFFDSLTAISEKAADGDTVLVYFSGIAITKGTDPGELVLLFPEVAYDSLAASDLAATPGTIGWTVLKKFADKYRRLNWIFIIDSGKLPPAQYGGVGNVWEPEFVFQTGDSDRNGERDPSGRAEEGNRNWLSVIASRQSYSTAQNSYLDGAPPVEALIQALQNGMRAGERVALNSDFFRLLQSQLTYNFKLLGANTRQTVEINCPKNELIIQKRTGLLPNACRKIHCAKWHHAVLLLLMLMMLALLGMWSWLHQSFWPKSCPTGKLCPLESNCNICPVVVPPPPEKPVKPCPVCVSSVSIASEVKTEISKVTKLTMQNSVGKQVGEVDVHFIEVENYGYKWQKVSKTTVESAPGKFETLESVVNRWHEIGFLRDWATSKKIIAVGVASWEGDEVEEYSRACTRAINFRNAMKNRELSNVNSVSWVLGKNMVEVGRRQSSEQRPLILIRVLALEEGVNLETELERHLPNSPLWGLNLKDYSRTQNGGIKLQEESVCPEVPKKQ